MWGTAVIDYYWLTSSLKLGMWLLNWNFHGSKQQITAPASNCGSCLVSNPKVYTRWRAGIAQCEGDCNEEEAFVKEDKQLSPLENSSVCVCVCVHSKTNLSISRKFWQLQVCRCNFCLLAWAVKMLSWLTKDKKFKEKKVPVIPQRCKYAWSHSRNSQIVWFIF